MTTVTELLTAARSWIGVKYLHQGRSRFGVDCIGFPIAVLKELDVLPKKFVDYRTYGRHPDGEMQPIVEQYCERITAPIPGSLVLMQWPKTKGAGHAAIVTGKTIIHAFQRSGTVVEVGFRGAWLKSLHSSWRLPGVTYE